MRKRKGERVRKRKGERVRKRERERVTGALAPFSYLVRNNKKEKLCFE